MSETTIRPFRAMSKDEADAMEKEHGFLTVADRNYSMAVDQWGEMFPDDERTALELILSDDFYQWFCGEEAS